MTQLAQDGKIFSQALHLCLVTQSQIAAFFDLDKTIIATSSAFAYGKEFMHSGLISPGEALQMSFAKASFMFSGHNDEQMDATKAQLAQLIVGWEEARVREIAAETLSTVLVPMIYEEARNLIQHHQSLGHDVVIISASARQLVEPIAAELGVSQVVATELEVIDGVFTGEVPLYCKGPEKARAILELTEERNYNLQESYAYSDSITDLPMLEAVGHPIVVNPDRALRKIAGERQWELQTFAYPTPLFLPSLPSTKEITISTGVAAALAALTFGAVWLNKRRDS